MKSILAVALALILNIGLWLALSGNLPISTAIPPLGELLHPYDGIWANTVSTDQPATSQIDIAGLQTAVEIYYDDRGVPHIYADNMEDAIIAMGYTEAKDRAFQLDFTRRAASGRLSELVGEATLDFDRRTLRNGMVYAAEQSYDKTKDLPGFRYIDAYTQGINAYLATLTDRTKPIECKILDYDIDLWAPIHTLYVTAYMSEYLNHKYDDLENSNLLAVLGDSTYHDLYPRQNPLTHPIVIDSDYSNTPILDASSVTNDVVRDTFLDYYYAEPDEGLGSNAWAINAALSATGNALYASDPHLNLSLPAIWYELQIHTPDTHVHGVKIVGVPGIMMGFNEHMAWGETNVGQDQADLYRIHWTDDSRSHYLLDGDTVGVNYRIETIPVKGQEPVIDTVRYTHWGPILYKSNGGKHDLAQRWIIHDGADRDEILAFVNMMSATGFSDFLSATDHYVGPPQNFNMATVDDTVAVRVNGALPLRSPDDGRFVEEGDQSSNGWQELIPRSQNPLIVNPPRGYVTSSNQRSTDETFPYAYHGGFSDYRNRAIDTVLSKAQNWTMDDMEDLHFDSYSVLAADLLPIMIAAMDSVEINQEHTSDLEKLRSWDYRYTADSEAATIFDIWFRKFRNATWDEIYTLSKRMDVRYPETYRLIQLLRGQPQHRYFDIADTEAVESASDLIQMTWDETMSEIEEVADDKKAWGQYKAMTIRHLARIPGMGVQNIVTDGCTTCINANGRTKGPSWRMVVDLGDTVKAKVVYPGGQSGNPLSPLYKSGIDKWAAGDYYDIRLINKSQDLPRVSNHLTVNPR